MKLRLAGQLFIKHWNSDPPFPGPDQGLASVACLVGKIGVYSRGKPHGSDKRFWRFLWLKYNSDFTSLFRIALGLKAPKRLELPRPELILHLTADDPLAQFLKREGRL